MKLEEALHLDEKAIHNDSDSLQEIVADIQDLIDTMSQSESSETDTIIKTLLEKQKPIIYRLRIISGEFEIQNAQQFIEMPKENLNLLFSWIYEMEITKDYALNNMNLLPNDIRIQEVQMTIEALTAKVLEDMKTLSIGERLYARRCLKAIEKRDILTLCNASNTLEDMRNGNNRHRSFFSGLLRKTQEQE